MEEYDTGVCPKCTRRGELRRTTARPYRPPSYSDERPADARVGAGRHGSRLGRRTAARARVAVSWLSLSFWSWSSGQRCRSLKRGIRGLIYPRLHPISGVVAITRIRRTIVPRSGRAALQLGLATIGTALIFGSLIRFVIVFTAMPPTESGFAEGLAIMLFGLYVLAGFVLLAVGLWIPQRENDGIRFSPPQRSLLAYGVVAPIVSVLAVPIGTAIAPPLSDPVNTVLVAVLAGVILSGPLATVVVVAMKIRSTLG